MKNVSFPKIFLTWLLFYSFESVSRKWNKVFRNRNLFCNKNSTEVAELFLIFDIWYLIDYFEYMVPIRTSCNFETKKRGGKVVCGSGRSCFRSKVCSGQWVINRDGSQFIDEECGADSRKDNSYLNGFFFQIAYACFAISYVVRPGLEFMSRTCRNRQLWLVAVAVCEDELKRKEA